jgi:hypothetical protein
VGFCRYYKDFVKFEYVCDVYTPKTVEPEKPKREYESSNTCKHILKHASLFDEGGRIDCVICEKCGSVFSDFQ